MDEPERLRRQLRRSAPRKSERSPIWGKGQHFRDPFVVEDPQHAGYYLMYYTAIMKYDTTGMCVGVAQTRNINDLTRWRDLGRLPMTDYHHGAYSYKVESPHAFLHVNQYTQTYGINSWYLFYSEQKDSSSIAFYTHRDSMTDLSTTWAPGAWNSFNYLYGYTGKDTSVVWWNATEYCAAPGAEYIAGFNNGRISNPDSNGIWMRKMQ